MRRFPLPFSILSAKLAGMKNMRYETILVMAIKEQRSKF